VLARRYRGITMKAVKWLALVAALCVAAVWAYGAWTAHQQEIGRAQGRQEVQAKFDAYVLKQQRAVIDESQANAKETQRRLNRQKENQDVQDLQLAAARADAGREHASADRLREQNAGATRAWRDALGDSAAGGQCAAAGDAIEVLADVLGRADRRAGELASYADAARIAGLKCEADYDTLTPP
jgi:hypothetical protein